MSSNLAGNQEFVDWRPLRSSDIDKEGKIIFYDTYGAPLKNARLAGGKAFTNKDGIIVWNEITVDKNYDEVLQEMSLDGYGWRQDLEMPENNAGISNWYAMHSAFVGAPIGFMRKKYFSVCDWESCGGKCLYGLNR